MTASYTWEQLDIELQNLWDDLDKIQSRLYTDCMKIKSAMHDVKSLRKEVVKQIGVHEASDDAVDNG